MKYVVIFILFFIIYGFTITNTIIIPDPNEKIKKDTIKKDSIIPKHEIPNQFKYIKKFKYRECPVA